jgi:TrkA domain protein
MEIDDRMAVGVDVQKLPGIGRRYEVLGERGGRIAVVLHNTGRRHVYAFETPPDKADEDDHADAVIEFSDPQARKLGAILGGAYFKPAAVQEIEAVIGDLLIEWVTLEGASPVVGRSIEEIQVRQQTGMTIVAIVRDRTSIPAPEPSEILQGGDRLVVVGRQTDFGAFEALVKG